MNKQLIGKGFLYRGQIVHVHAGGAAIWPSWLDGERVDFLNDGEARAFVDARQAAQVNCCCFEFVGDNPSCRVHGGERPVVFMAPVYAEACHE